MHSRRGYDLLAFARRPSFGILAVAAGCLAAALATQGSFASRTNLAVGFAAALPMIVTARGPLGDLLSLRPLVVLGAYTYAAYLVHPLAIGITDRLIDYGQADPTVQLQRLTIATALSFFAAAVLFHTFEKPLIRVGHRLAHRPKQLESVNPG
jgi:peptidoglycan/LPS O-acetylase OafA/YrhL